MPPRTFMALERDLARVTEHVVGGEAEDDGEEQEQLRRFEAALAGVAEQVSSRLSWKTRTRRGCRTWR
jgi:hypothetical protein